MEAPIKRANCTQTGGRLALWPPRSYTWRVAARRIFPLEVFSTVWGGANTTWSAGSPMELITARLTAFSSASKPARSSMRVFGQHHQIFGAAFPVG